MPNQYSAEVMELALAAGCSERTVRRYLDDPDVVSSNNRKRIEKAITDKAEAAKQKAKRGKGLKRL